MRIAIVADTYPPLRISGAVQMRDLAREFAMQGHEPTVIIPSGALEIRWKVERANNVTVLRCRTPPTKDIGYVRRTINEMRLPYALLRALRESDLRNERWDGVVWYSPSIFLGPIVRVLRRESRCRSYLILRDIFPEWAVDMGLMRRGPAYHFFKMIERGQYSVADTVGVQTGANLAYMSEWAKQPGRRLEVLQNWLSDAENTGCRISIDRSKLCGRKIFVYVGNMGIAQGMNNFIDLAARMRKRNDVGFLFVGRGSETARLTATSESQGLDNVMFHDEIDPAEIPGLLAQCQVGIVALDPRHKTHNVPGKFLTYMQAGIPVLARINPGNDLENLINDEGVGRVCTGGDAATLQRLADELIANPDELIAMRGRGRTLSRRLFSSAAAVRQIVAALSPDAESTDRRENLGFSAGRK
jgi:glycosyltransferase involved in cell wall biosynthesis